MTVRSDTVQGRSFPEAVGVGGGVGDNVLFLTQNYKINCVNIVQILITFLYFGLVIILLVLAFKSKSFVYKQRSSVCYNSSLLQYMFPKNTL